MSPPRTSLSLFARRFQWMVLVVLPLATLTAGCGSSTTAPPTSPTPTTPQGPADLQIIDVVAGTGDTLNSGNQGTFIFSLWHYDPAGTDGSKGVLIQSASIQIRPGVSNIITGVTQGIVGMQTGGTRRLIVPPSLAYGSTGSPSAGIAPNEWVVFEFQLLEVRDCAVVTCQT